MIGRAELQGHAQVGHVDERTQERDYVLAWLLAGLASNGAGVVFKGGTCLRRCYFPGYRYSEDLDFTVSLDPSASSWSMLSVVAAWCAWANQESGLQATAEADGDREDRRVWVSFTGPLRSRRDRAIKVDVTDGDDVLGGVETRMLLSEYSDIPPETYGIPCYSLAEIWAEKTRSLMQRSEPRDVFDLAFLVGYDRHIPADAFALFQEKARAKDLDPRDLVRLLDDREESMRRRWQDRLTDQVAAVPPFEATWRELRRALRQSGYFDF